MRKILKALSLVMVLVMCFTMVFTTAVSAEGTDTLVLSVDNAAPKAGDTVNITVTSNFTTVAGAHFAIDLAGLEYVSVAGDYAEYFSAETMNFVKEFNEDNGNLVESGVLFVITATVPADAEAGTVYNVGFGTIATNKEFCDYNENEVVVTKTGVDVTVAADEPEVPECDHEWEVTEAIPATGEGTSVAANAETAKGSITHTCSVCGESKTEEVSWWNRYTFNYYNINMASQIELVFNLRESRLTETAGNYEDVIVKAVTVAATEEVTTFVTDVLSLDKVTQSGNLCYPVAVGVPAKQLTDEITAVAFVKRDGVWYSGTAKTNSVESLCQDLYANITDAERTLYANLLTYGSKAQTYFTYKTDDLADANLGNYASYVTTTNPDLVSDYVNTYNDPCIRSTTQALSMAAKTEALVTFRIDKMTEMPALSQVTATAVYADGDAVVAATYGSDTFADANHSSGARFIVSIDSVYPKYMRKNVTVTFAVDGVTTDSQLSFSIAGLAQRVMETANLSEAEINMYYAMINYADAAAAYFGVTA